MPASMPILLGYTSTEMLQEGASTVIYRALRERDGQPVMLKMPRSEHPPAGISSG